MCLYTNICVYLYIRCQEKRKKSKGRRQKLKTDIKLMDNANYINLYLFIWMDGEGNGTPLQYSCLENPMDGRAW